MSDKTASNLPDEIGLLDRTGEAVAAAGALFGSMVKLQAEAAEAMLAGLTSLSPVALARDGGVPTAWSAMADQLAGL